MPDILIIHNEYCLRAAMGTILSENGFSNLQCRDSEEAISAVRNRNVSVAIIGAYLPDTDNQILIKNIIDISPATQCILMGMQVRTNKHSGPDSNIATLDRLLVRVEEAHRHFLGKIGFGHMGDSQNGNQRKCQISG